MTTPEKIHLTIFDKQNAGPGQMVQAEVTWQEVVDVLTAHVLFDGDKSLCRHFNGVTYGIDTETGLHRRMMGCVEMVSMLVLDFDHDVTIEQAKDWYRDYTYCLYSSYNHQRIKKGEPPIDKFRVVFPLASVVTKEQWEQRIPPKHNLGKLYTFAPNVDPASKRLTQPFCAPIQHPTEGCAVSHQNEGKWLELLEWPIVSAEEIRETTSSGKSNSLVGDSFDPDQEFRLA